MTLLLKNNSILKLKLQYERGMVAALLPNLHLAQRSDCQTAFRTISAPKLDPRGTRNYYISSPYNAACHISLFQISDAIVFRLLFRCGARSKWSVLELPFLQHR